MQFTDGRYSVNVAGDGAIKVRAGDWLSKYSAAIHGNFLYIHEYARKSRNGGLEPIANPDLIRAGETIYYTPPNLSFAPITIQARPKPAPPGMSNEEKRKIIAGTLQRDYNLRGNNLPLLNKIIQITNFAGDSLFLAECAGLIAEGTVLAGVGTGLSFAGAFLFPIGGAIAIANAWQEGEKLAGLRAVAYATTAWSFGDRVPSLPARIKANMKGVHGNKIPSFEKAWNDAARSAVETLTQQVMRRRIQKKSLQMVYRAVGDNNRKKLARALMDGMALKLKAGSERDAFMAPTPDYPVQ